MICDEYICYGIYISEDQMKAHSLLVAVKNVTWYEFRPRFFEREERGERGEEDLMAKGCSVLSLSSLFRFCFLFSQNFNKFERTNCS
jgi:hypothetical protein